jgi:hypothetical protein
VLRSENPYIECIDSLSDYGDIASGEEKEGTPFVVYADSSTLPGYAAEMKLILSSQEGYRDSIELYIKVGLHTEFLIWDPDENHSSGPVIKDALEAAGYVGEYSHNLTDYFGELSFFRAIFICLGVYPHNYVLKNGLIVDSLCSFLDKGGRIYMEGGDTWTYDAPTDLHPYFQIPELYDGFGDTYTISGMNNTFTQQMNFTYSGENNFMDRLTTMGGSFAVFRNLSPYYTNGVAYDAGYYRTVGFSFEFGGLTDGTPPSTKKALADSIMRFFGFTGIKRTPAQSKYPNTLSLSKITPNPFIGNATFNYSIPISKGESSRSKRKVSLKIFDICGRKIITLVDKPQKPGCYSITWNGNNSQGSKVSQGTYFVRLTLKNKNKTRKIILVK